MGDQRSSQTPKSARTAIRRFTLVISPVLLGLGITISLLMGCSTSLALQKGTAYMLSGLGGWAVYLLIRRPSRLTLAPGTFVGMNVSILNPTRTPWPFPEMLAHGLAVSVCFMSLVALGERLLTRDGKVHPSSVHPLSDVEVDQPAKPA